MNKIFMIGDIHLGLGYPNSYEKWHKTHEKYFNLFLIPYLKENVTKNDIIILLGDFFDDRDVLPIKTINFGIKIMESLSNICDNIYIIVGNHDLWTNSISEINSINIFKHIKGVKIIDKPTIINFDGRNLGLVPYIKSKKEMERTMTELDCEYIFCHTDLSGAKMHMSSVGKLINDKIEIEKFSKFKRIFSGHYHIRQVINNLEYIGNIFQMDRGDMGDIKGISVLDFNISDVDVEFIPNKISPIFEKFFIKNEEDINYLLSKENKGNYWDLYVSNDFLMRERKNLRLLDELIKKHIFQKIDYLNDMEFNRELNDEELVLESIDITEGKKVDMSDLVSIVKDYINMKDYKNTNTNSKLIEILDELYLGNK